MKVRNIVMENYQNASRMYFRLNLILIFVKHGNFKYMLCGFSVDNLMTKAEYVAQTVVFVYE